mmetsp:Transcript_33612/g.64358  ORF Transcript_33612/g.64358 Transcript_33612/m.64358 type:complete len:239 (+) Transcript_33612:459-1175(+)
MRNPSTVHAGKASLSQEPPLNPGSQSQRPVSLLHVPWLCLAVPHPGGHALGPRVSGRAAHSLLQESGAAWKARARLRVPLPCRSRANLAASWWTCTRRCSADRLPGNSSMLVRDTRRPGSAAGGAVPVGAVPVGAGWVGDGVGLASGAGWLLVLFSPFELPRLLYLIMGAWVMSVGAWVAACGDMVGVMVAMVGEGGMPNPLRIPRWTWFAARFRLGTAIFASWVCSSLACFAPFPTW